MTTGLLLCCNLLQQCNVCEDCSRCQLWCKGCFESVGRCWAKLSCLGKRCHGCQACCIKNFQPHPDAQGEVASTCRFVMGMCCMCFCPRSRLDHNFNALENSEPDSQNIGEEEVP